MPNSAASSKAVAVALKCRHAKNPVRIEGHSLQLSHSKALGALASALPKTSSCDCFNQTCDFLAFWQLTARRLAKREFTPDLRCCGPGLPDSRVMNQSLTACASSNDRSWAMSNGPDRPRKRSQSITKSRRSISASVHLPYRIDVSPVDVNRRAAITPAAAKMALRLRSRPRALPARARRSSQQNPVVGIGQRIAGSHNEQNIESTGCF